MKKKILLLISMAVILLFSGCGKSNSNEAVKNKSLKVPKSGQVYETYNNGSITTLEEDYMKAQVYNKDLYIELRNGIDWECGLFDANVLDVQQDKNIIKISGIEPGRSAIMITGIDDYLEVKCDFYILIQEDLTISFTESVDINVIETIE